MSLVAILRQIAAAALIALSACGAAPPELGAIERSGPAPSPPQGGPAPCRGGEPLTVRFYGVGQALAALLRLPDGRHVLVDTGEAPNRSGCGAPCAAWHAHLLERLERDLGSSPIDMVWITHQHSDHLGGAIDVLNRFRVIAYVDNGRDAERPLVARVHEAARSRGTAIAVVDPEHLELPLPRAGEARLSPFAPPSFPASCSSDANACSIGLRVDYCASSVLFTGDAERSEEASFLARHATLLQVGHHGSETSSTEVFLEAVRPRYAVISAAQPGEGTNASYCHPRSSVVERLTRVLGGPGGLAVRAFSGASCRKATADEWRDVAASDRLWITARDGDVVLETRGDGVFRRIE